MPLIVIRVDHEWILMFVTCLVTVSIICLVRRDIVSESCEEGGLGLRKFEA